ncbi:hypothetical protein BO78DRAFT_413936 [Aspergillus sclerotiicarbonarius CBS 121057]|uniref:Uncharacterized protein n=1 Tax=Aspergillus sclerotiicarbonarius (strain CBS 121057 / IBT 28362) TaxID=1448318 RepID=A0A319EQ76_ASPSB|nr:hypothetical protein BO78DRAFT_413936 [Aspergillus sclerotiicarbonarius CBS 121057]
MSSQKRPAEESEEPSPSKRTRETISSEPSSPSEDKNEFPLTTEQMTRMMIGQERCSRIIAGLDELWAKALEKLEGVSIGQQEIILRDFKNVMDDKWFLINGIHTEVVEDVGDNDIVMDSFNEVMTPELGNMYDRRNRYYEELERDTRNWNEVAEKWGEEKVRRLRQGSWGITYSRTILALANGSEDWNTVAVRVNRAIYERCMAPEEQELSHAPTMMRPDVENARWIQDTQALTEGELGAIGAKLDSHGLIVPIDAVEDISAT